MTDSRLKSITENGINIAVGFPINYLANILILPHYNFQGTNVFLSGLEIGIWFTIVSVVRSYALRRIFERFGEKENAYTLSVKLYKKIKGKFLAIS